MSALIAASAAGDSAVLASTAPAAEVEMPAPKKAVKAKRAPEPIPANETIPQRAAREQRERQVQDRADDGHKALEREAKKTPASDRE